MQISSGSSPRTRRRLAAAAVAALATGALAGPVPVAHALPTGMHYELVSPADVGGTATSPGVQSPDGERVQLVPANGQGFGDTPSYGQVTNQFVAVRRPSGWVTVPMNPPAGRITEALDISPDLRLSLARTATVAQDDAGTVQYVVTDIDKVSRSVLPVVTDLSGRTDSGYFGGSARYVGASAGLDHIIFKAISLFSFLSTDGPRPISLGQRLYEIDATKAVLRRVDLDEAGAVLGEQCGALFGGFTSDQYGQQVAPSLDNAISSDGSRIFFSGYPGTDDITENCLYTEQPQQLYARVDGVHTVHLSASECGRPGCVTDVARAHYQSATPDGERVAFISAGQLTDSDVDTTPDLYLYDFAKPAGHHLTQASIGDATSATPGAGAGVEGVTLLSDNGSRVYFVATGVLTTLPNALGAAATAGAHNLYVYEPDTGTTRFITALAAGDDALWGAEGRDGLKPADLSNAAGDVLVFNSSAQITASDTDGAVDVYRYDARTGALTKVSPGNTPDAAAIVVTSGRKDAHATKRPAQISADGSRIVFATTGALAPDDVNGALDVYLWNAGSVEMVSDGRDPLGVTGEGSSISSAGDQIAFATQQRLVPEDVDTVISTYVARAGDDIVRTPDTTPSCAGDACQGAPGPSPAAPGAAPPADGGLGNLPAGKPAFKVRALSASGRATLARTGSAKLSVTVSEGGAIVATARGSIGRRTAVLGIAKGSPTRRGAATLTLRLTKAARAQLAARGRLAMKLSVTYSKAAGTQTQALVLTRAKATKKKSGR
jgi:hypothetical protein